MISAELTASVGDSVAPGATWGIPGPPFLAMFVAAAVLAVAAVLFVRTAATRGTAPANTRTAGGSPPPGWFRAAC